MAGGAAEGGGLPLGEGACATDGAAAKCSAAANPHATKTMMNHGVIRMMMVSGGSGLAQFYLMIILTVREQSF
jgi:hypothetical protein